jgi:hypothetical protein
MARLMITCPTTGKLLSTGIGGDRGSLERGQYSNNLIGPCPHCGQGHVWSKSDTRVVDD